MEWCGLEGTSCITQCQAQCHGQGTFHQTTFLRAPSNLDMNTPRKRTPTIFLIAQHTEVLSLKLVSDPYALFRSTFSQSMCYREERRKNKEKPLIRGQCSMKRNVTFQPRKWTFPVQLLSCRSLCQFAAKICQ